MPSPTSTFNWFSVSYVQYPPQIFTCSIWRVFQHLCGNLSLCYLLVYSNIHFHLNLYVKLRALIFRFPLLLFFLSHCHVIIHCYYFIKITVNHSTRLKYLLSIFQVSQNSAITNILKCESSHHLIYCLLPDMQLIISEVLICIRVPHEAFPPPTILNCAHQHC
jgi:hypothetical protein